MAKASANESVMSGADVRELAFRQNDGLQVQLLYRRTGNLVILHMLDDRDNTEVTVQVPNDQALEAYYHPYAYLPFAEDPRSSAEAA